MGSYRTALLNSASPDRMRPHCAPRSSLVSSTAFGPAPGTVGPRTTWTPRGSADVTELRSGPSSESLHLGHLVPFLFTKWLQETADDSA